MKDDVIFQRVYAEAEWVAESALHVGGGRSALAGADSELQRDSRGNLFVSGTTIAGLSRNAIRDAESAKLLFGRDEASRVDVSDAVIVLPAGGEAVVRDSVRIDSRTGASRDGAKFDFEVVPAGAKLPLRLRLDLYRGDDADRLREAFYDVLEQWRNGMVRIGARTRSGFGRGKVSAWTIRTLEPERPEHLLAYLSGDLSKLAVSQLEPRPAAQQPTFSIQARLGLRGSVLVRQAATGAYEPDVRQHTEAGVPLIPGTSWKGCFRQRCSYIAKWVLGDKKAAQMIASLFGPTIQDEASVAYRGRVTIDESKLESGALWKQGRICVDRFTQAPIDGALIEEAAFWGDSEPDTQTQFSLRLDKAYGADRLSPAEIGLLLLAFKDLWLEDLPVGGESGIGRGRFHGNSARICGPNGELWTWKKAGTTGHPIEVEGTEAAVLESYVAAFTARDWEIPADERALISNHEAKRRKVRA